jgi:CheY-like chemotaxis protein
MLARTVPAAPLAIVAEDDDAARRLVVAWLEHNGYRVVATADGVELLECLERLRESGELAEAFLVVTDIDMPRRDGLAALALIGPRFPGAAAVVVTAFGDASTLRRARALGAAAVLDKPFRLTELAEAAGAALRAKVRSQRQSSGVVRRRPVRSTRPV